MNYQEKVKEFQLLGGEDFAKGVTPLREALLKEEITELEAAIKSNNRVEILDALCDIVYVALGTCNLSNVTHKFLNSDYYASTVFTFTELTKYLNKYAIIIEGEKFDSSAVSVCYALASTFNFSLDNFKTALDRVHESNMSKFCNTEQEAIDSVTDYTTKGVDTYSKRNGDKWVIYRLSDNKILKSKYYKRVQLEDLV